MRTITCRVTLIIVLLVVSFLADLAHVVVAATASEDSTLFINPGFPLGGLQTDGKTVVWIEFRADPRNLVNGDIYAANLTDRKQFPVAVGSYDHKAVDISNGIVVWEQTQILCPQQCVGSEIHAKNLATGQEFKVGDGRYAAISNNWVVWWSGSDLMGRDISSTASTSITLAKLKVGFTGHLAISGNRVVWGEQTGDPVHGTQYTLYTLKIGDNKPPVVIAEGGGYGLFGWNVQSDTIVYSDNFNVTVVSLNNSDGTVDKFSLNLKNAEYPSTDGRYIFWTNTSGDSNHDITGYDLKTNVYLKGLTNSSNNNNYYSNSAPGLRNGLVFWSYTQGSQSDSIHVAPIAAFLPTARQPQFQSTSDRYYFQQTGHTLSFGFKYFWEHSGGLPVFGYPLTEEFQEINADNAKNYTVQYFERQRYEYHPEFKGTPYETELGRLGAADALQRNLYNRVSTAFPAAPKSSDPNCTYFPQTQHNVCGSFGAYWHTHGLEFGDAGVSFREAVALFGYPISEQFKDPDSGLMVQYFERARFEHQPQFVGTPNEVELGLLGQQVLRLHGWPL